MDPNDIWTLTPEKGGATIHDSGSNYRAGPIPQDQAQNLVDAHNADMDHPQVLDFTKKASEFLASALPIQKEGAGYWQLLLIMVGGLAGQLRNAIDAQIVQLPSAKVNPITVTPP
jgi:hypothetical protein